MNIVYRSLNMLTVFGLTILLSKLCGVAGYGMYSLLIANVALFSLFSAAGSDAGITYHVASGGTPVAKVLRFALLVLLAQVAAAVAADLIIHQATGHYFFLHVNEWMHAWPGLLLFITTAITEKCSAWLLGKKAYVKLSGILFFSNLVLLGYFIYAWIYEHDRDPLWYIRYWCLLSGLQAFLLIIACIPFLRQPVIDRTSARSVPVYNYALFTFVINSIQFLAYRIDLWILEHFKGEEQLGWYALAVKLSQLFWILPLLLASIIFPQTASGLRPRAEAALCSWIRLLNGINIIAAIGCYGFASWLIPLIFGEAYRSSVSLFLILLPGVILFCSATLLAAYFGGRNELKVNLWGSVLCLTVIGTLDLILIPVQGMRGAAIASTIGYGITGIYFLIRYSMHAQIPFHTLLLPGRKDAGHLTLQSADD